MSRSEGDPRTTSGGTSGKAMVLGFFGAVGLAACLLLWAIASARGGEAAPVPSRMPRPIAAEALPLPESEGAQLLQRYCVGCHGIPDPAQHVAARWPAILTDMDRQIQSRIMRAAPRPSREEWSAMEAYLQAHAADGAGVAADTP